MFLSVNSAVAMDLPSAELSDGDTFVKQLFKAIKNNQLLTLQEMILRNSRLINNYGDSVSYAYDDNKTIFSCDQVSGLHIAAAYGRNACLKILLDSKADPRSITKIKGNTPLHFIQTLKGARLLVKAGADVEKKNIFGKTPLSTILLGEEHAERDAVVTSVEIDRIARLLLTANADINTKDNKGDSLFHQAMRSGNAYAVDFLLTHNARRDCKDAFGLTPFDVFFKTQHNADIIQVFAKHGTFFFPRVVPITLFFVPDVLEKGSKGSTFLNNWAPVFAYVYEINAYKLHACSDITPMGGGVMCNQYGCIVKDVAHKDLEQIFTPSGVKIIRGALDAQCTKAIALTNDGKYKMLKKHMSVFPFVTTYGIVFPSRMVKTAIEKKDTRCLEVLLTNKIVDQVVNAHDRECGDKLCTEYGTFLHMAVFYDNIQAISLLMKSHADCLICNEKKMTPIEYAVELKRDSCINQLNELISERFLMAFDKCEYKKSKQLLTQVVDCNVLTGGGEALLHRIVRRLNMITDHSQNKNLINTSINLLIKKGADPNLLNKDGESALWYLVRVNSKAIDIFEALLSAGARINLFSNRADRSLLSTVLFWDNFDLVKLFLQYGVVVSEQMIQKAKGDTKKYLQEKFNTQSCLVCAQHPEYLFEIPCKKQHLNSFLCADCYNQIHMGSNKCPYCSEQLN